MDNETRQMFELVLQKLDGMEKRQDEMYLIMRSLEGYDRIIEQIKAIG